MLPDASAPTRLPRNLVNSQVPTFMPHNIRSSASQVHPPDHPQHFVVRRRNERQICFPSRAAPSTMEGMKKTRTWQGVRMRRVMAGVDPDAAPRLVTLPAAWDDTAAAALAALAPGEGPVALPAAADAWIRPVAERALRAGLEVPLAE